MFYEILKYKLSVLMNKLCWYSNLCCWNVWL